MKKYIVLAGTIPVFNGSILILQRSLKSKFLPSVWGLPCGKIGFGEDVEEAALRELEEETGITGDIEKIVGTSKFLGVKEGVELHNVQVNYLIKLHHDNVTIDSSSEAYKWIKIEDFEESEIDDFNKSVIRQVYGKK